jgi:hypothetical protein
MKRANAATVVTGRRFEPRKQVDQHRYHSVEFSLSGCEFIYQFKIRDLSSREKSILVKEGCDLLNHLKAGDVLDLKYYTPDSTTECLKTQIMDINKGAEGRFKGAYLVELSILEKKNPAQRPPSIFRTGE